MTPRRRRGTGARPTSARIALTLVAALAFFLQSLITQTHIHVVSPSGMAKTIFANTVAHHQKSHDPFPANEDPANCPLCQEITHAGQYITPVFALQVAPPVRIAHVTPVAETRATDFILSHAWRSRAPPTA